MNERPDILLVEDSATQAARMSYLLEQQEWEVRCETSAESALESLNQRLPDLILADYHLPGMSGDELCRRVRMNVHTRGLPILMLTADSTQHAELRGLESGADDYVSKSVEDDLLLLRVRALLRKSRAEQAILGPGETYFRRARVLVIDDSPTYLLAIAEALREEGFNVETAAGGEEGLARVRSEAFDCVIVDLVMPGMDGIAVCRYLTEYRRSMDSPIVVLMLTASESKTDMTRGLDAGADDFVGKSNDTAVLKARIRALLRRKFFQEENQRIAEELKHKELEALRARAEKEAAEARAALVEQLEAANRELKETQSQLLHSEKMASLGQLVAGIAHEINNPLSFALSHLATIRRGVDALLAPFEQTLDEAAARKLDKVRRRCGEAGAGLDRVKELVQKLRTFSRLDAGVFASRYCVTEGVEMALTFLQHKMGQDIEVVRDYAEDSEIACYPGELNQVLMNLLSNAVDAIDGPGTIGVTTRREEADFVIRVADTGRGIAHEVQHRVFEPFFTTKPVGAGMGFGLSLSYGIVQAHRGEITFESPPGRGTTFTVRIPLDLGPDARSGSGSEAAQEGRVAAATTL